MKSPLCMAIALGFMLFTDSWAQNGPSIPWRVIKDHWSDTDERGFREFVAGIGMSRERGECRTVDQCMKSAGNPWRASDPRRASFWSDCADLPYLLRAYFAAKNGLPFSYTGAIRRNSPSSDGSRDIRYVPFGNRVTSRIEVRIEPPRFIPNALAIIPRIQETVSSGKYRMDHTREVSHALFSDFYPVPVDRDHVQPGTVIYDPDGHVAVVYKVERNGRVFFIDAHPDNTLSFGEYSSRFDRGWPSHGGGFLKWRPTQLVNYDRAPDGLFIGGHMVGSTNAELAREMSLEQYFGTENTAALVDSWRGITGARGVTLQDLTMGLRRLRGDMSYLFNGSAVANYHDWVRFRLTEGDPRFNPVDEMRGQVQSLCNDLQERVNAVQDAINAGIHNQPHPDRLPGNIYGTSGDWETYSTPSRDARLKTAFQELRLSSERFMGMWRSHDPMLLYAGNDLAQDILGVFHSESRACTFSYVKSDGVSQAVTLEDLLVSPGEGQPLRLWLLSFDPYQCPERRWGASAAEVASCVDTSGDGAWYGAEQVLRNQIDRTYDVRMDFNLTELQRLDPARAGVGAAAPPDVDVEAYLLTQSL